MKSVLPVLIVGPKEYMTVCYTIARMGLNKIKS